MAGYVDVVNGVSLITVSKDGKRQQKVLPVFNKGCFFMKGRVVFKKKKSPSEYIARTSCNYDLPACVVCEIVHARPCGLHWPFCVLQRWSTSTHC